MSGTVAWGQAGVGEAGWACWHPNTVPQRCVNLAPPSPEFALQVKGLSKSFPGVQALAGVQFEVAAGQVHALMGENGAGKSTLMRVVSGLEEPDSGQIVLQGRVVRFRSPHDALKHGIAMIHQELLPFPELSVAENIFMGQEPASRFLGWLDKRTMRCQAARLLARLGVALSPARRMKDLSVAEMQMVEIAKALAHRAQVIIMDEPTSALSAREVAALFNIIRDLKSRGTAIVYISHKLEEVFQLADAVTVLRDGRFIGTHPIGELNQATLVSLMVGRELPAVTKQGPATRGEPVLAVRGFTKVGQFHDINLEVRRGEILGLAGLMGAGRTELASAIFGLSRPDHGTLHLHGRAVRVHSPAAAIRQGIGLVSEDRKESGLVLKLAVKHNLTLASLRRYCRGGFVCRGVEAAVADEAIRSFAIMTPHRDQPVALLSGGNQQKVVLAKALLANPEVLILDEPTRGIDIGAKAEVHSIIARLAAEGKAVLLVSSELPEILALSHRILVLRAGSISAELDPRRTTQEEILKHAMPA